MKKFSAFIIIISLSAFFIFSCQKDKTSPTYSAGESNNLRTAVTGIVFDENNSPLSGVAVTAYGQTTTTSQYGTFVLKNLDVNKDRCVLQFSKTGFFNRTHGFIASGNTVNYVRIVLSGQASSQTVSAASGGAVSLTDGSSVDFQPNSFVTSNGMAYNGTVNIAIKHLSHDDPNFGFTIPGGDLLAKNLNNEDVVLITYGMLGVELTGSSGEPLQLASGKAATLTMNIAASQLSSAPASIPLWYFDETISLWKEEGVANKVGNNYVGTVNHFTWWNCDYAGERANVQGKVVDCNGNPMSNIVVTFNGWLTLTTDQNGNYMSWVPAGLALTIQVLSTNNFGILSSQLENVSPLNGNQTFTVPDLIVPCPTRIEGTIHLCTGEVTDGFVTISNNAGFINFQYTLNGIFNLSVIENSQLEINAWNQEAAYFQNTTSLFSPNVLNVGSLLLCDSTDLTPDNNFTLNGGSFSNQVFNILTTTAIAQIDSTYPLSITIIGTASGYNIQPLNIALYDTVPGTYSWQAYTGAYIYMQDSINSYQITPQVGLGSVTIVQVDNIGGRVKGYYSGQSSMDINNSGQTIPVSISGHFDVLRTQ